MSTLTSSRWLAVAALTLIPALAQAADGVRGKLLYSAPRPLACDTPGACHGVSPVSNVFFIQRAANNWTVIQAAIAANRGGMGALAGRFTEAELRDIAAFIGNTTYSQTAPAMAFGNQMVGAASATQTVTLGNPGNVALTYSLALAGLNPGDFTRSGTCVPTGGSLAVNASCTVIFSFNPAVMGARAATLSITHSGTGSPATLALSGTGVAAVVPPAVTLNPTSPVFPTTSVGTLSAPQTVQIANSGAGTLNVSALTFTGPFERGGGSCADPPFALAPGVNCTVTVVFRPTAAGNATGQLSIVSNAPTSPNQVALSAQAAGSGAGGGAVPNVGYGGCSAGNPEQLFDPLLLALLVTSLLVLGHRRVRRRAS